MLVILLLCFLLIIVICVTVKGNEEKRYLLMGWNKNDDCKTIIGRKKKYKQAIKMMINMILIKRFKYLNLIKTKSCKKCDKCFTGEIILKGSVGKKKIVKEKPKTQKWDWAMKEAWKELKDIKRVKLK